MNWLGSDHGDLIAVTGSTPASSHPTLNSLGIYNDIVGEYAIFGVSIDMSDPDNFIKTCREAAETVERAKGLRVCEVSIHID